MFVAFCGMDGSGKTTQLELLATRLRESGTDVLCTKQPSSWYRSDPVVRSFLNMEGQGDELLVQELALFAAADRVRHVRTQILPSLERGETVLTDRYVFSTYAYFLARGIRDIEWLKALNRAAPLPDLTFFLDVSPKEARDRIIARDGGVRKKEELDLERMSAVRSGFLGMVWGATPNFFLLDGTRSISSLAEEIWASVDDAQNRRELQSASRIQ